MKPSSKSPKTLKPAVDAEEEEEEEEEESHSVSKAKQTKTITTSKKRKTVRFSLFRSTDTTDTSQIDNNDDDNDNENVCPATKRKSSKASKPVVVINVDVDNDGDDNKNEDEDEDEDEETPQVKPSGKTSKLINYETHSIPNAKPSSKRTRPADEGEDKGEEDHVDDSEVEEGNQQAAMTETQVRYDKVSIFCLFSDYMTTNACSYKSGAIPLPSHCPRKGCGDTFPHYPSWDLLQKLIDYQEIIEEEGSNSTSQEYLRAEIALCFSITTDSSLDEYVNEARMMGWKHEIDFTTLTPRILEMKDMLTSILTSKAARSKNPVYKLIEKTLQEGRVGLGLEVFAAAKQIPQSVITRSRPG